MTKFYSKVKYGIVYFAHPTRQCVCVCSSVLTLDKCADGARCICLCSLTIYSHII